MKTGPHRLKVIQSLRGTPPSHAHGNGIDLIGLEIGDNRPDLAVEGFIVEISSDSYNLAFLGGSKGPIQRSHRLLGTSESQPAHRRFVQDKRLSKI